MEQYQIKARQSQIDFHRQESEEGPNRKPPMPPEQVEMHKQQLALHIGLQITEQSVERSEV